MLKNKTLTQYWYTVSVISKPVNFHLICECKHFLFCYKNIMFNIGHITVKKRKAFNYKPAYNHKGPY